MIEFCEVHKYDIEAYPEEYNEGFAFYDTVRDEFKRFDGQQLFDNMGDFLLFTEGVEDLGRYTTKIPEKFRQIVAGNDS